MIRDNKFELSPGNIKVLETISLMMQDDEYRTELRKLTLSFITGHDANHAKVAVEEKS